MTKKGRPKGSVNKTYVPAFEIPAVCPKCGGNQLIRVPGNKPIVRHIAGILATGEAYTEVTWTRRYCKNCGQRVSVRAYLKTTVRQSNNAKPIIASV